MAGNTSYEWQIRTHCDANGTIASPYTSPISFLTTGPNCRLASADSESEVASLSIVPNPFSSSARILLQGVDESSFIRIYDLAGRIIRQFEVNDTREIVIQRNNLEPGIYIVELSGNRVIRQKLIVE